MDWNRRVWRCLGITATLGFAAAVGACSKPDAPESSLAQQSPQQTTPRLGGVWRIAQPVFQLRTVDGGEPPLKPEAAQLYREHMAARKRGDLSFDSGTWCASVGMPRILLIDYPFEIVVDEPYISFLHEWNWWTRLVYLPGSISAEAVNPRDVAVFKDKGTSTADLPGPMGLSRGKWENDTLVVETTHFIDMTLLDSAGLPHSEALKLTERLKLLDADTLENRLRIEDPNTFTAPWETVVTFRRQPGVTLREDVCLDRIKNGEPAIRGVEHDLQ